MDNKKSIDNDSFKQGFIDCVPTLLGYLSIGLAAGVVQKTAGLYNFEIFLLSSLLYAGSAQFIIAAMFIASSSVTSIVITILFVNLRHILLSAALSPYFKHLNMRQNFLIGLLLTDETFGVAINKTSKYKQISKAWMHGLNITAYLNWIFANLAGAFLAQWVTNPAKFGLEFALPAMFIGILVLAVLGRKKYKLDVFIACLAAVIAVFSSLFVSTSFGIIIATVIAAIVGMVLAK